MWLKLHIRFLRWLLKRRYHQKTALCHAKDSSSFTWAEVACLQEEMRQIHVTLQMLEHLQGKLK
jgi:hypothetical protein